MISCRSTPLRRRWDDDELSQLQSGGGGAVAEFGQVILAGAADLFDQPVHPHVLAGFNARSSGESCEAVLPCRTARSRQLVIP